MAFIESLFARIPSLAAAAPELCTKLSSTPQIEVDPTAHATGRVIAASLERRKGEREVFDKGAVEEWRPGAFPDLFEVSARLVTEAEGQAPSRDAARVLRPEIFAAPKPAAFADHFDTAEERSEIKKHDSFFDFEDVALEPLKERNKGPSSSDPEAVDLGSITDLIDDF